MRSCVVGERGSTNAVKKVLHFLETFPGKTGKPGEIMRMFNSQQDRLSSEEVNAVAMYIMHKKWINESYLFTLYALKHYHLDARVMVDYLAHERQNLEHLKQYLDNISANRVDPVLEFLASLATCSHSYGKDLLDKLRKLEFLPNNYLEGKNVAHLFSAERILKMMEEVCAHKGLHLPLGMKKLKLKNLFRFLMSAFEAHQVEIADFIKIVDIAAERLKIGHEVTVEFFQSRIPALASYYSKECGLQDPETPPNSILKFEPRQCMEPNQKLHDINKGLTKVMVSSVDDIKTFRRSLSNKFKSIALASHQPSDLIPGVSGCDMISVRTLDGIFHLRKTGKEDELVKKFVDELRDVIHTKTFFVGDGVIKYLAKELNLQITKFVDVTFGRNGKSVSVNDMAQRIVKEDYCERASFFSAHALPSVEAQRHWELQLSLTFECGQLKLDAQGEGAYSHT